MTVVSRLTGVGTFLAYDFDETVVAKFRVSGVGTAFSNEFDENTATTLTGTKRMSATSTGGLIVFDSINEIDPIGDVPTDGLQLHIDSALSTKTETAPVGQQAYTSAGTNTFTVPAGCTSISAVCIGGGGGGAGSDGQPRNQGNTGGGGGALAYGTIPVTPGETLTVTVGSGGNAGANGGGAGGTGGDTTISRGATVLIRGGGGGGGTYRGTAGGSAGTRTYDASVTSTGGGDGGAGGTCSTAGGSNVGASGGGGAGGYSAAGGVGGNGGASGAVATAGSASTGGGGGGGGGMTGGNTATHSGSGGGVGILGAGANGTAGTVGSSTVNGGGGGGGSSGATGGTAGAAGGAYGGGGGAREDNTVGGGAAGGVGAVRIIWGSGRSYPSTSVADAATSNYSLTLSDLSGNSRTASSVNGAIWSSSNSGVVNFDGTDDYMTISAYKGITGTGARTSILFFKTNARNISPRLFGWGATTAGNKWNMSLDVTTYRVRAEIATGSVLCNIGTRDVTDGRWHMIAASAPASGTANDIKVYIDGDLITDVTITSGATAINTSSGTDVSFGASLADAAPGYLNGQASKFLIYNRQLSDLEIKVIYRTILNRY